MRSNKQFVVSGIDTDAGKTVASVILCRLLKADYWKPVQAGTVPHTDSEFVSSLVSSDHSMIHPEAYLLEDPMSPHAAAARAGVTIREDVLSPPETNKTLIIEGAGGLMVPLRDDYLFIDLFAKWSIPVVLVVKTYLGCINHSLLSIEALRSRDIPLAGIIFNEGGHPESEEVILSYAKTKEIGRIPQLGTLTGETLDQVIEQSFISGSTL